ncbi:MAG: TetR/AcrR family transcriptional regulator [Acidimicrobiales bacterium]
MTSAKSAPSAAASKEKPKAKSPKAGSPKAKSPKQRLTAERVIDGAMGLADEIGTAGLTIRKLADHLDTKPMTIYHHVAGKEAILDGIVDRVFAQIDKPPTDLGWKAAMRHRCISAREILGNHPWAAPLMESRVHPGPETLSHHDAVLGCLRCGGLSWQMTGHAYALLDAFVYGFALQEAAIPATGGEEMEELAESVIEPMPEGLYPNLIEFTIEHVLQPGYDFRQEFEYGLDLILDALEVTVDGQQP